MHEKQQKLDKNCAPMIRDLRYGKGQIISEPVLDVDELLQ